MNINKNEWAPNSNRKRQYHNLVGYANADRLLDKANRPDIVIKNRHEKSCLFIDMTIPTEKNTSVKVTEKLSNIDLEIEIERM